MALYTVRFFAGSIGSGSDTEVVSPAEGLQIVRFMACTLQSSTDDMVYVYDPDVTPNPSIWGGYIPAFVEAGSPNPAPGFAQWEGRAAVPPGSRLHAGMDLGDASLIVVGWQFPA